MAKHVIVGAGPVGQATAAVLVGLGHEVTVVTRSGTKVPGAKPVVADASDAVALTAITQGAAALYNCVNPPYTKWAELWPSIAAAMLTATERTGVVLATTGNLYGYGPLDHPMHETDALAAPGTKGRVRAQMWIDAKAAHDAGRVRATEVRGSDYFGPLVLDSALGERVVPKVLAGKGVSVLGDPDALHSFTYVPDVARTLVVVATDERAWGRPWHVPSAPALTQRETIVRMCAAAGVEPVKVKAVPPFALSALGVVMPVMRELKETAYQFNAPFVLDSSATTTTFGLEATPLDEAMAATVAWFRTRAAQPQAA